ncbi:MAG TPA: sulfatase, partial [Blastocatellia bacterium]|nr:sulfatase [Blastocatellia bacterium]
DRNPMVALAMTALPRITASSAVVDLNEDWRASLEPCTRNETISRWAGSAAGRNVVMMLLESAGAAYLTPYADGSGDPAKDPMPNLSEMARRSIVFDNAYSVYPESVKGLFSVLCSRYPAIDTETESYARAETPSIAAELKSAGYRTALFHSGRFMYLGMDAVVANRGYDVLEDAGAIGGNRESSFGVDEGSSVRRALDWIDSLPKDDRFFLTYLPIAGHHPYESPESGPFPGETDADRYLNALHYADRALGSLTSGLRQRGLEDRTLFVIFGDHGEAFGQHDGNYGHSLLLYDENIRVPYLISAPGLINRQVRSERVISLIDTAPTILDLVGLRPPAEYQGRTALAGDTDTALFCTDYSLSLMGLRDGCWKYLYELDSGRSKLFDLCQDPMESNDVSGVNSQRVTAYRSRVTRWSAAQKGLLVEETGEQRTLDPASR